MFYILHLACNRFPSLGRFAACPKVCNIKSDVVDYLNPAEDGEASEEAHVATHEGDEGGEGDLHVLLHNIISRASNVQMDYLQWLKIFVPTCVHIYNMNSKHFMVLTVVVLHLLFVKPFIF